MAGGGRKLEESRAEVGHSPVTSRGVARVPFPAHLGERAAAIALQRAAGNAATVAAMGRPGENARTLARFVGGCSCGGRCPTHEEEDIEARGARTLARAVGRRRTLQRMAACPPRLADSDPTPAGWKP